MESKYFKPKSVTWWSGTIPLVLGVIVASVDWHGFTDLVTTINNLSGNMSASAMITWGCGLIGLRGKDG